MKPSDPYALLGGRRTRGPDPNSSLVNSQKEGPQTETGSAKRQRPGQGANVPHAAPLPTIQPGATQRARKVSAAGTREESAQLSNMNLELRQLKDGLHVERAAAVLPDIHQLHKAWVRKMPGGLLLFKLCGPLYRKAKLLPALSTWRSEANRISRRMAELKQLGADVLVIQRCLVRALAIRRARALRVRCFSQPALLIHCEFDTGCIDFHSFESKPVLKATYLIVD